MPVERRVANGRGRGERKAHAGRSELRGAEAMLWDGGGGAAVVVLTEWRDSGGRFERDTGYRDGDDAAAGKGGIFIFYF
jgi:hypothetical protein